jgi:methionyl-tRNA formyltransferase
MTRFVYFGDGQWATDCLRRLLEDGHEALAVVLRRRPSDGSLEAFARERGLQVLQPEKANRDSFVWQIGNLAPELNISMSYDQIVRRPLIDSAPLGFINCHAGKLPRYRGRNVINWAIINNESEIGVTVHHVDEGIDTGDIILQRTLPIGWEDTYGSILGAVTRAFPDLLSETVAQLAAGTAPRTPQDHAQGTYFGGRGPGDEWIDWNDTSLAIYNKIRAITHPGPGARSLLGGSTVLLWRARYDPAWPKYIATPGEVVGREPDGVGVKTGDSIIILESVAMLSAPHGEHQPDWPIGTRLETGQADHITRGQRQARQ